MFLQALRRLSAVAAIGCLIGPAQALPTVYFGEDQGAGNAANLVNSNVARAQFAAQLTGFGSEGFEAMATGTEFFNNPGAQLNFAGAGITASLSGGLVRDLPFNARFAAEGQKYLDTSFNQRLTFSAPVAAFGLFITDAHEVDNNPATVTVNGALLTQAQIEARPFDSVDGIFRIVTERSPGVFETLFSGSTFPARDSTGMFVGLIDAATPFTNIILINGASGLDTAFTDGFGYDGMMAATASQLAPVPEPATWALLAAGLAAVGRLAHTRRRRT